MSDMARTCCQTTCAQAHADGCSRVEPEPVDYLGQDGEVEYLVERYADGELRIKTRPLGGVRWSPAVVLREAS